ncbi:carboxypeptidase regulatory-like domain-containing protein [Paraflavitalea speifideaquila]|uniref:carboxypeptidase regulatory-like domain-containing protein n=1 Tax=Paraflavitalea speifideaquila TaxID=3076558 RepID=UPI0028E43DF3|nr:carboxypeptidase regulatory-like domain-containing protein [Paraflavitalea speifideiaquila]
MIALKDSIVKWCWPGLLALLCTMAAYGQEKVELKGMITAEDGAVLAGVSIAVQGEGSKEKQNHTTNDKGVFTLDGLVAGNKYHFTFTHVGYQPYYVKGFGIKAGVNNSLIVRMKEVSSGLNEVVVIGYGAVKKKDVTGAISSVKSDKIMEVAAADATQVLQGRVSGVMVQT